jgi:hypothetical protein
MDDRRDLTRLISRKLAAWTLYLAAAVIIVYLQPGADLLSYVGMGLVVGIGGMMGAQGVTDALRERRK